MVSTVLVNMVSWYQMYTAFRGWKYNLKRKGIAAIPVPDNSRENALMFRQDLSCVRSEVIAGAGYSFLLSGSSERTLFC